MYKALSVFFALFLLSACTAPPPPETLLQVMVRVRAPIGTGSGTIIYSKDNRTFIMTNYHVVSSAVEANPYDIGAPVPDEYKQIAVDTIEGEFKATVFCFDKKHDIAILEVNYPLPHFDLYSGPPDPALGEKVYVIGCGGGELPFITEGRVTLVDTKIEDLRFIMLSAPSFFGNSGGAAFVLRNNTYYFLGIPSRLRASGFGAVACHMDYIIPMDRIFHFFRSRMLHELLGE